MDFFKALSERHSIRAYKDREVEDDKLDRILEAIRSAPTAGNLQAYEVVLVKSKAGRDRLAEAAHGQTFISKAPVNLVFLANPGKSAGRYGKRGEKLYSMQDATIAVTIAHLAATALGLGSAWVGAFDDSEVRKAVDAPADLMPVAILPIGYPDEEPQRTPRRDLKDIVRAESF